jgi:hypothetical protein
MSSIPSGTIASSPKVDYLQPLSDYYKSHLYQISRGEAREIGLNVVDASDGLGPLTWELYNAYAHLIISGEAEGLDGRRALVTGIGHIDSSAGTTIGLAISEKTKPGEIVGARWESHWLGQPVAPRPAVVQGDQPAVPPDLQLDDSPPAA